MSDTTKRIENPSISFGLVFATIEEGLERAVKGQPHEIPRGAIKGLQRLIIGAHQAYEEGMIDGKRFSQLPEEYTRSLPQSIDIITALAREEAITQGYAHIRNKFYDPLNAVENERLVRELAHLVHVLDTHQTLPSKLLSQYQELLSFCKYMSKKGEREYDPFRNSSDNDE